MITALLADQLKVDSVRINNCCNIFDQWVHSKQVGNHKLTNADKILLNKLLNNVKDDIKYDYPLQKLYVYMIILFSNFISEGIFLDLDEKYMNIVIQVLLKSNIVEELFKLL